MKLIHYSTRVKLKNSYYYHRLIGRTLQGLIYADPVTYSGSDSDKTFDTNDELVFMARHLGDKAPTTNTLPTDTSKVS